MSTTTTTLTMATSATAQPRTLPSSTVTLSSCCPGCGYGLDLGTSSVKEKNSPGLLQAQARIAELEAQVTQLNEKAAEAVARWAEYEAELHKLRSQQRPSTPLQTPTRTNFPKQQQSITNSPQQLDPSSAAAATSPTRSTFLQQGTSRISALLYPRKSTPNLRTEAFHRQNSLPLPNQPPLSPGAASTEDLLEALTREQTLRKEAEGRLTATSQEVEELSVSLFEQANEMVAEERRARAKLEERVGELEKRDADKRRRLETLEGAMGRIERVRNLLGE